MKFRLSALILGVAVCSTSLWAQQYMINLVSGNGVDGYAGDGGAAIAAQLSSPSGVALDPATGKIYIADEGNNRIRVITKGNITTFAGNGTPGYTGDGSAATSAEVYAPFAVTVDSSSNLYIVDTQNNCIRMVTPQGIISTVAGNEADGGGYSGDGGPATNAQLFHPLGVALDSSGNIFISDAGNNLIREVFTNGEILTVGNGNAPLNLSVPRGIAVDSAGNLFVADTGNNRIVEFSAKGVWSVVAGSTTAGFSGDNGPATQARLTQPYAVAVDSAGQLYIADTLNSRIRKISTSGIITTIAGDGAVGVYAGDGGLASSAALYFPNSIAVDAPGNVYIADTHNDRLRLAQLVPSISSNAVVNAASFAPQLTPGALATVFGYTAGTTAGATLPLPAALGGISVNVNGQGAPLLYVNANQVNFQLPWETPVGNASITIAGNGFTSNSMSVPVLAAAPGLFQQGSSGQALVQNADLSLNGPASPAKIGSTITTYLTGSGPLSSALQDGVPTPLGTLVNLTSAVAATIGSATAKISFAGMTPGLIGVVQMNVVIPSGLTAGAYPLTFTVGGQASNSAQVSVTP